jgi:polyhydroxybutyrate depolymerase
MGLSWNNITGDIDKVKTQVSTDLNSPAVKGIESEAGDSANSASVALSQEVQSYLKQGKPMNFSQLYTSDAATSGLPHLDIVSTPEANTNTYTDVTSGQPPKLTQPGGSYQETITQNGIPRTFTVHLPSDYDPSKPSPMIVLMHGLGGSGDQVFNEFGGQAETNKLGAIVVTPNAIAWSGDKDDAAWQTNNGLIPPGANPDDAGFLDQMIKTTEKQVNVDPSKVGMWGFSDGGMMTLNFASGQYSKDISSFETVSTGADSNEVNGGNPNSMNMSGLLIHGTADSVIPINGLTGAEGDISRTAASLGGDLSVPSFLSASDTAKLLATKDGITSGAVTFPSGNSNVQKVEYKNGTNTIESETVQGGGHAWYGQPSMAGTADGALDTTDEMWNFFQSHPKLTSTN